MIISIAWRNIWRHKIRSVVIMMAIAIGVWALLFGESYMLGMTQDFIKTTIEREYSHLQIHHRQFKDNFDLKYAIPQGGAIVARLQQHEAVKGVSPRVISNGMIASARATTGAQIVGIEPGMESTVSRIDEKIIEGGYLNEELSKRKKPILVGEKLAEKLNIKVGSRLITITTQNVKGEMISIGATVVGIFNSGSSRFDQNNIYMISSDLLSAIDTTTQIYEIAVLFHDIEDVDTVVGQLKKQFPGPLYEDWKELGPELELFYSQLGQFMTIFIIIIMLALAFGLINTMLMAVLERVRELGMLMAIGMNKTRLFMMIVVETVFLSLMGAPLGMLFGYITIIYFSKYGIDYSQYAEGMQDFGMSTVIYLSRLDVNSYITIAIAVVITAIISSLYPSLKALKLNPVDAIRKI